MSYNLPFSETHRDCLQEVVNVAMGAAGESLADYTGKFVDLPIPVIRYVSPRALYESMPTLQDARRVSGAVQSFATERGVAYAMVVVADEGLADLAILRGLAPDSEDQERDLLLALTGVICDTCLATLGELANRQFALEPPFVVAMHQDLLALHLDDLVSVDFVTSVEIPYQLENHPFRCDLLLLFPENFNQPLIELLDQMLAE